MNSDSMSQNSKSKITVFKLTNISKAFQETQALDNISLTIEEGEMLALIGPSGSGKTTLLKLLNGQNLPTSGKLTIDGADIETLSRKSLQQARQKIAYIPQDLGLVPNLKFSKTSSSEKLVPTLLCLSSASSCFPH